MKYEMKLNNDPYTKIKEGTKTIELGLNDEKRQKLKIKDLIEFKNMIADIEWDLMDSKRGYHKKTQTDILLKISG